MAIKTFRGKLDMGLQKRLRLSTNDGLTGYRVHKFQIMPGQPGVDDVELVAQIFLTDQTGSITNVVDFNDADLLAACYYQDDSDNHHSDSVLIIFDKEAFNQDIYVNITDAGGATAAANYYIELEQFKMNINESTFATLKNIRSTSA